MFVLSAPSAPVSFNQTNEAPRGSHGPRINLTWGKPIPENGKIRNYTIFYSHSEDPQHVHTETFGTDTFTYSATVLGGVRYQFHVRAVTIKPGPNTSLSVNIPEYGKEAFFVFVPVPEGGGGRFPPQKKTSGPLKL